MLMILRAFLACAVIAAMLFISEFLWRSKVIKGEAARKTIHIMAGTFIAFLPFWLDYGWIVILAIGFIAVNAVNHIDNIFKSIFSVKRRSWGDLLFSFAILVCALVEPDKWIFAAAILHVSLADGLAALVGTSLGKHHGVLYRIFHHEKSAIGSATFLLVSFFLTAMAVLMAAGFSSDASTAMALVLIPIAATILEGVGIYGVDNLTLPTFVLAALTLAQHV
jgi:phytol kinase